MMYGRKQITNSPKGTGYFFCFRCRYKRDRIHYSQRIHSTKEDGSCEFQTVALR